MDKFEYGFLIRGEYHVGQGHEWYFESKNDNRYPKGIWTLYAFLNELGLDGWELTTKHTENQYILKRKVI